MLELIIIVYLIGLITTENLLWPLLHIPQYCRWQEQKEITHKVELLEMQIKEKELLKIQRQLDEEMQHFLLEDKNV